MQIFRGGGWCRKPETRVTGVVGSVAVAQVAYPHLLNGSDPDVSFAYSFCGSIGADPEAAAERGKQKARFGSPGPQTLVTEAKRWAGMLQLAGVTSLSVQVQASEDGAPEAVIGHADLGDGVTVEFYATSDPKLQVACGGVSATEIVRDGGIARAKSRLLDRVEKARGLKEQLDALGVFCGEED